MTDRGKVFDVTCAARPNFQARWLLVPHGRTCYKIMVPIVEQKNGIPQWCGWGTLAPMYAEPTGPLGCRPFGVVSNDTDPDDLRAFIKHESPDGMHIGFRSSQSLTFADDSDTLRVSTDLTIPMAVLTLTPVNSADLLLRCGTCSTVRAGAQDLLEHIMTLPGHNTHGIMIDVI